MLHRRRRAVLLVLAPALLATGLTAAQAGVAPHRFPAGAPDQAVPSATATAGPAQPLAAGEPSSTPDDTAVTNGPVHAVLRSGDTVYLGGRFDRVGPRTGPGVEVGLDGLEVAGSPEVSGSGPSALTGGGAAITAVAPDGAGGWYVGGLFSRIGGVPRANLAHVLPDRTVDPAFAPVLDDAVRALVVTPTAVHVAGLFTSVSGVPRSRLAAVRRTDGAVTAFAPDANAGVEALALSPDGSVLYAGGRFTVAGGLPRVSLAALDVVTGRAVPTFNAPVTGTLGQGVVNALTVSGSTLFVGGSFTSVGGLPRNNLAALRLGLPVDGAPVPAFDATPSRSGCAACGSVSSLAVSGSTVYAGGMFDTIGGQKRSGLAGLDAATGAATPFDPSPDGGAFSIAVAGSTVYAVGGFRTVRGPGGTRLARDRAAAFRPDGSATAFDPVANGTVAAVAVGPTSVYLGGYFSSLGGVPRAGLAAISAVDGSVLPFDAGVGGAAGSSGLVQALALAGSTLLVGGSFTTLGGQPRSSLGAVDLVDGRVTPWDPTVRLGSGKGIVDALAVSGPLVYVAGAFTGVGGQSRANLAALDLATGAATGWDPGANSEVAALAVSGERVYVGGFFTSVAGRTRNKLAALRASDGAATSWDPDATAQANVLALAVSGGTVYAGGNFTSMGGAPRRNLAAVSAADGRPTPFNPDVSDPTSGGGVHDVLVSGGTVYAAGFFTRAGGEVRHLVAGLRPSDGSATAFDPRGAIGFGAFALDAAPDGTLHVGGSFSTVEHAAQQGAAQFRVPA